MSEPLYLIQKRGLYYAPKAQGYTGVKARAGRYTLEECALHCGPNGPDGPRDGITFIREEDAPNYSPCCFSDIKERHMQEKADALQADIAELVGALREIGGNANLSAKVCAAPVNAYRDALREIARKAEAILSKHEARDA